jgi:hypothetical protein
LDPDRGSDGQPYQYADNQPHHGTNSVSFCVTHQRSIHRPDWCSIVIAVSGSNAPANVQSQCVANGITVLGSYHESLRGTYGDAHIFSDDEPDHPLAHLRAHPCPFGLTDALPQAGR